MQLKVLSWNIWHGKFLDEIISFLKLAQADIIGLQEVLETGNSNTADIIAKALGYHSVYFQAIKKTRLGKSQGNATLSKYPLEKTKVHFLSNPAFYTKTAETEPRIAVEAKIKIDKTEITVFTTHLAYSLKFRDSKFRDMQVDNLDKLLPSSKAILMGDFNSYPDSKYIQRISKIMTNTDKDLTKPTWPLYPHDYEGWQEKEVRHRLDYIFVSKDIKVKSFQVEDSRASDHYPISAVLEV